MGIGRARARCGAARRRPSAMRWKYGSRWFQLHLSRAKQDDSGIPPPNSHCHSPALSISSARYFRDQRPTKSCSRKISTYSSRFTISLCTSLILTDNYEWLIKYSQSVQIPNFVDRWWLRDGRSPTPASACPQRNLKGKRRVTSSATAQNFAPAARKGILRQDMMTDSIRRTDSSNEFPWPIAICHRRARMSNGPMGDPK